MTGDRDGGKRLTGKTNKESRIMKSTSSGGRGCKSGVDGEILTYFTR